MIVILFNTCAWLRAQDTTLTLETVTISTQRAPSTLRTAMPTQVATVEKLEQQGALQLSDAVKFMAGVILKDYGGVGGMKTVSARGLGSQFSTICIDGVPVGASQNGQVDLGRYMVTGAAYVSFSQGQEQSTLLSAKGYAAGNVLNLESREPSFFMAERTNLKVGMEIGSFGMLSPSAIWERKWSRRLKSSMVVNYLKSNGDYPYTLYYNANHTGRTSTQHRTHSAMHLFTADANLYYTLNPRKTFVSKVHYSRGMHQLPGHVVLFRTYDSEQSTHEEQLLAQTRWRNQSDHYQQQVLAKWQYSHDLYDNPLDNMHDRYRQNEFYLSGTHTQTLTPWLEASAAVDAELSRLHSNLSDRSRVLRSSLLGVAALRVHWQKVEVGGNLLAYATHDHVSDLDTTPTFRRLSPTLRINYSPSTHFTLRYFYKDTYRAPTFSELYFFNSAPRQTRPELARQHNVGLTWLFEHLHGTADLYYNHVRDKIVARPGPNMYYWRMENLGVVDILGADLTASASWENVVVELNYSFAHAVDHSNPSDKHYGHQIPYTPRHSGGLRTRWENPWVNVGLNAMLVGHRSTMPQSTSDTRLPAYTDFGLSLDHLFNTRFGTLRVQAQVLNLFNTQYEVVQYYPMMGRNFRLSLVYEI